MNIIIDHLFFISPELPGKSCMSALQGDRCTNVGLGTADKVLLCQFFQFSVFTCDRKERQERTGLQNTSYLNSYRVLNDKKQCAITIWLLAAVYCVNLHKSFYHIYKNRCLQYILWTAASSAQTRRYSDSLSQLDKMDWLGWKCLVSRKFKFL